MESGQESPKSNLEERREDKMVENLENVIDFGANREKVNGEMINVSIGEDKRGEEANEPIGSPSLEPESIGSPLNSNFEVNSTPVKGYGLKKWRRIRRDLNKDTSGGIDSLLILKRQLSLNELRKAHDDSNAKNVVEVGMETSAISVGSFHSVDGVTFDPGLARLVASGGFSIGMNSDNSEDQGSKSSTATSFPKLRHEIGFGRERTRVKNVGGRGGGHALQQRSQRGRGCWLDTSKESRRDRIRLEKENSMSSVESDLRILNFGLLQCGSGVCSGNRRGKSLDFAGENGDEAQMSEEGDRSGYYKENGTVEELLREDLEPDLLYEESRWKRGNFRPPSDIDPFVESIAMLQAAQDALGTEIKKIGEIGKATTRDDFDDQSVETEVSSSATPEPHVVELIRKMDHLQCKLEEAATAAKAKESKVIELEGIINRTRLSKNRTSSADEVDLELEAIIKNKIQAEIEFLIVSRAAQSWKVMAEDQIALLEGKNVLKVRDAEDKAMKLKDKAEELEKYRNELLGEERVLKLKNKVCKLSCCSFVQLLLLCVALGLFLIQLMNPSEEFVPT